MRRAGRASPRTGERAAHPLAALGHRLVGKANDRERGQARADVHLHIDRQGLDTLEGDGLDMSNHAATPADRTRTRYRPGAGTPRVSYPI